MMLRNRLLWILGLALATAAIPSPAAADGELDGRAIIDRFDRQNRAQDEKDVIAMTITSASGAVRRRGLTTWFKNGEGNDAKILVRFDSPADLKGTGLLTIEEGSKDEQWLYLPDLHKSKRISGASKALSFMGTDLSNYDMRTEDLSIHVYTKVGEETLAGRPCFIVEAKPKDDDAAETTGYGSRKIWVDKERFTVPKAEFYDRSGRLLKVATTEAFVQVSGLWKGDRTLMENKQEGSKTLIEYKEREVNKGVPDRKLSKRELENP